jgi:hypothetical protein
MQALGPADQLRLIAELATSLRVSVSMPTPQELAGVARLGQGSLARRGCRRVPAPGALILEWIANEPWIAAVNPTGGVRRNEAGNVWVRHSQSIRAAGRQLHLSPATTRSHRQVRDRLQRRRRAVEWTKAVVHPPAPKRLYADLCR